MKKSIIWIPVLIFIALLAVAASLPKYVGRFYGDGLGITNLIPLAIPNPLWTNTSTFVIKTNSANGAWVGVVQDTGLVKSNAVTGKYFQVDTNGFVGIGVAPQQPLHVASAGLSHSIQMERTVSGQGSGYLGADVNNALIVWDSDNDAAERLFVVQSTAGGSRVGIGNGSPGAKLDVGGDIRGSRFLTITNPAAASQPGLVLYTNTSIGFYAVTASNPPTSGAGTAFIFPATNAAGTAEIFTMDGAGVIKQISEHAMDAPTALIDDNDEAPNISKEILRYTGKVRWINRSREARLQERSMKVLLNSLSSYQFLTGKTPTQWTNSVSYGQYTNNLMVLDAMSNADRQVVIVETFADYNTRNGFTTNSPLYLVIGNWTDDQNRLQAEYATSYTNAVNAALSNTNAVAPVWSPPAVQPVPAWLYKRGVR